MQRRQRGLLHQVLHEKKPPSHRSSLRHEMLFCVSKRVAYVTAIVKRSLENHPVIPNPQYGFGWVLEGSKLEIEWMLCCHRPQNKFYIWITCSCKKNCTTRSCSCNTHGLSCSDLCKCKNCENRKGNDSDIGDSRGTDSDNGDDIDDSSMLSDDPVIEDVDNHEERDLSDDEDDTNFIGFGNCEIDSNLWNLCSCIQIYNF